MKLAIFGATGGVGRHLVEQALEAGHEVRALARRPERLGVTHERLEVVQGDISDAAKVEAVVAGADAVLSALGPARGEKASPEVFGQGMRHIVDAMKKHGVKRLVSISGAGLEVEGDAPRFSRKVMRFLLLLLARHVLESKEREWEVIRQSGLEWVVVRPPRMVEGPKQKDVKVSTTAVEGKPIISKADVAAFMLKQAEDDAYVGKARFVAAAA